MLVRISKHVNSPVPSPTPRLKQYQEAGTHQQSCAASFILAGIHKHNRCHMQAASVRSRFFQSCGRARTARGGREPASSCPLPLRKTRLLRCHRFKACVSLFISWNLFIRRGNELAKADKSQHYWHRSKGVCPYTSTVTSFFKGFYELI